MYNDYRKKWISENVERDILPLFKVKYKSTGTRNKGRQLKWLLQNSGWNESNTKAQLLDSLMMMMMMIDEQCRPSSPSLCSFF